jgi:uncharacterized protein (DUF1919 family)
VNEFNIITLGINCAPALVAKDLELRKYSLPFDWIVTNNIQIINCIEDDFSKFHKKLHFTLDNHWQMDEYGIQYPHEYPVNDDGTIVDNWQDYHEEVLVKYQRRIDRFKSIMSDTKPLIALYFGKLKYANTLKQYLEKKYNRIIVFVVATNEKPVRNIVNIIICNVYSNEESRDKSYWINGINDAISITKNISNMIPIKRTNKIFMKLF